MRLLLDTTYVLPAIGISIKNIPNDAPLRMIQKGHEISMSETSIFELSAKGAKFVASGKLPPERVVRGIRAIMYNEEIEIIPNYESRILLTAFKLRNVLTDFIDCLILSTAVNGCEVLVTEDNDIKNLRRKSELDELLKAINPEFKIQTLAETI